MGNLLKYFESFIIKVFWFNLAVLFDIVIICLPTLKTFANKMFLNALDNSWRIIITLHIITLHIPIQHKCLDFLYKCKISNSESKFSKNFNSVNDRSSMLSLLLKDSVKYFENS